MKQEEMRVICPSCGEQIPIDDKVYHRIVNDVCNEEVNRRVQKIKGELDEAFREKSEHIKSQAEGEYKSELEKTRRHFVELREASNAKIESLKAKLDMAEKDKVIAVGNAVKSKDLEISDLYAANEKLTNQLRSAEINANKERETLRAVLENENKDKLIALASEKDKLISSLRTDISTLNAENRFKEDQIASLKDFKSRLSTKLIG